MKYLLLISVLSVLFYLSCSKTQIKQEANSTVTREPVQQLTETPVRPQEETNQNQIDPLSLQYQYEVFIKNQKVPGSSYYTVTNTNFINALANEMNQFKLSRDSSLKDAISNYDILTQEIPEEAGFLHQRMAVSYFKMQNYSEADQYLNLAISEDFLNNETYYYKTLLEFYFQKDPKDAMLFYRNVNPKALDIHLQDWKALEASLYLESGNTNMAIVSYQAALKIDPVRFYQFYNLLPFYLSLPKIDTAQNYVRDSVKNLLSLKNKAYRIKAYEENILFNQKQKIETIDIDLGLSSSYDYYPNLLLFSRNARTGEKFRSRQLAIPLQEKKHSPNDKVYSSVFEDYWDDGTESKVLLAESILDLTNIRSRLKGNIPSMVKLIATNTTVLLLSPTNTVFITTNLAINPSSRDYIVSNQSNALDLFTPDFQYFSQAYRVDMNTNRFWSYVFLGWSDANLLCSAILNPQLKTWEIYKTPIKTSGARLIIQDINQDGKKEILLLDDDVYTLSPQ